MVNIFGLVGMFYPRLSRVQSHKRIRRRGVAGRRCGHLLLICSLVLRVQMKVVVDVERGQINFDNIVWLVVLILKHTHTQNGR